MLVNWYNKAIQASNFPRQLFSLRSSPFFFRFDKKPCSALGCRNTSTFTDSKIKFNTTSTNSNISSTLSDSKTMEPICTVSWNIAGINRNPLEFWMHTPDKDYNKLMDAVELFINDPKEKDILVGEMFTQAMYDKLHEKMSKIDAWKGSLEFVTKVWEEDFSKRKIVSSFLLDSLLGDKRLMSMPDRVTNTIETPEGTLYRPTIINNYDKPMPNLEDWFAKWIEFMFDRDVRDKKNGSSVKVYSKFKAISKAKYPKIEEDEAKHSLPLQALALAIFDAVMVHMMQTVGKGFWFEVKTKAYETLNQGKVSLIFKIMESKYSNCHAFFLQEATKDFCAQFTQSSLNSKYFLVKPSSFDGERNQNSVAILSKTFFDESSCIELDQGLMKTSKEKLASGDLLLFSIAKKGTQQRYLLSSFHGDTGGMSSLPVIDDLSAISDQDEYAEHICIYAMDANCYADKKADRLHVADFAKHFGQRNLCSSFDSMGPGNFPRSTMNARTFCQPQLNKAVTKKNMQGGLSKHIDANPKDFILHKTATRNSKLSVVKACIDNTGDGPQDISSYDPSIWMPGAGFPSDHAILYAEIQAY
eukprot:m.43465 g.43465  ORF g.43465 m.43465 type:complete len:585 (+) comp9977_c0_seq3:92-1846(+)